MSASAEATVLTPVTAASYASGDHGCGPYGCGGSRYWSADHTSF